jgi:hypothetical protein
VQTPIRCADEVDLSAYLSRASSQFFPQSKYQDELSATCDSMEAIAPLDNYDGNPLKFEMIWRRTS